MKTGRISRWGKRTTLIVTAALGAALTLFASGFFAMRAFAAGPSEDNDYVAQYSFADGETLVRGDAQPYGDGTYGGKPATKGEINGSNISLKTTAERAHYAFRGWKVTKPDSGSSVNATSSPYNVGYTNFVRQGETNLYLVYASPLWKRNCRVDYYVDGVTYKTGSVRSGIADSSTESYSLNYTGGTGKPADRTIGSDEVAFCGWTTDPTGNGNKVIDVSALPGTDAGVTGSIPYACFSDEYLGGSTPQCTYDTANDCFVINVYAVYVRKIRITYVDFDPDYSAITAEQKTFNTDQTNPAGTVLVDPQGFTVWNASTLSGKSGHTTESGHLAVGWYLTPGFAEPHYAGTGASATVSDLREDTTLYARWFVRGTSSFYRNYDPQDNTPVDKGGNGWQYVPLNGKAFYKYSVSRDGYTCLGWNTDRNAATGSYDIHFSDLVRQSDGNYENDFYAIWEKNVYTVDFIKNLPDDDRLAFSGDLTRKTYNDYAEVSGGVIYEYPTARGYWVSSVQVLRADNNELVATITGREKNDTTYKLLDRYFNPVKIKVKFIWVKSYRYTYDRNLPGDATISGHIPVDQYKNGNEEGTSEIPLPGLVGEPGTATMANGKTRRFKGWSLSDDNDQSKIITGLTESEFGSDFDLIAQGVNGDRTSEYHFTRKLYAVWEDNVSIFYDGNGGKMQLNTKEHVTENSADASGFVDHPLIDSCQRENHTFTGWNTSADGSGTHYDPGQPVTTAEDLSLFAEWEYSPSTSSITTTTTPVKAQRSTEFRNPRSFPPSHTACANLLSTRTANGPSHPVCRQARRYRQAYMSRKRGLNMSTITATTFPNRVKKPPSFSPDGRKIRDMRPMRSPIKRRRGPII